MNVPKFMPYILSFNNVPSTVHINQSFQWKHNSRLVDLSLVGFTNCIVQHHDLTYEKVFPIIYQRTLLFTNKGAKCRESSYICNLLWGHVNWIMDVIVYNHAWGYTSYKHGMFDGSPNMWTRRMTHSVHHINDNRRHITYFRWISSHVT